MCGIVGYISNNDKLYMGVKDHFMRFALALDTLRGEDSTGLFTVTKRFTVKSLRTTMPGDQFVQSKGYLKKYKTGWAQIGHNRAATRGEISIANTHPFTFGPVTLVHNGTLKADGSNFDTYDKSIGVVDSMQIALALSERPANQAKEVLEQIDGSFAIVWSDTRDESINMARNLDRPLHICFNATKSIMWFMSDGHHLYSINKSLGIHEAKGQSIFEMDRNKILKFKKGSCVPEVIKYDPFVYSYYQQNVNSKKKTSVVTPIGGKDNSSVPARQHLDRWKAAKKKESSSVLTKSEIDGNESSQKVTIQGRLRRVPSCMQAALAAELYLSPDDLLQFQPDDAEIMVDGTYLVYGTMIHKDWSDTPWDMTVYGVSKVQYRAYKEQDWLVRPIGLCPPHSYDPINSAVMGSLVHCDWMKYLAKIPDSDKEEDDKEGDLFGTDIYQDLVVPGPGGDMIEWPKLQKLLAAGCVNCLMDIYDDDITQCLLVNNNQDLCCVACVKEMTNASCIIPTIN